MNCQLLEGHSDTILSLEINDKADMLVTGSKVQFVSFLTITLKRKKRKGTLFKCLVILALEK